MTTISEIASLGDIAAGYDAILCDVWGVVHDGKSAFPAAVAALARFRAERGPVLLLSNAPRPGESVIEMLDRIKADTEEICVVEQFPRMEGRLMVMMLAPKKKQVAPAKAAAPAKPAAGASAPAAADGAKAPSTKPAGAPKIAA